MTKCLCFILLLASLSAQNKISVELEETVSFPGGWSLAPEEIYYALKHCEYDKKLNVLEFGSGEGTKLLVSLLKKKNIPFEYHSFENDPAFIGGEEEVVYHHYDLPEFSFSKVNEWAPYVAKYDLPPLPIFDLIIIDGPHGVGRAEWYAKCKKYTRPGIILLIDDFHHFEQFKDALDENFTYQTIIEYNQNSQWKIINEGVEVSPNLSIGKTFKIVKIY